MSLTKCAFNFSFRLMHVRSGDAQREERENKEERRKKKEDSEERERDRKEVDFKYGRKRGKKKRLLVNMRR